MIRCRVVLTLTIIVALFSCLFASCVVLQEDYDTPAEIAQKIVKQYHETHVYSEYDFFVCSDMALDVWDMLKAQGINAIIQIGNVKTEAKDITDADHAWILAEVSPGEYLALETTGGYAVWDNPLYYKGWSFDNPKEYKRYVELKYEFNVRANIVKGLVDRTQIVLDEYQNELSRYQELLDEFNIKYVGHPVSLEAFNFRDRMETQLALVKVLEGKCSQLTELMNEQTKELENIGAEMRGLVQ